LKRFELLIGFLLGFATLLVIFILSSDVAAHYEICETTKEGAKNCARYNVVSFALREVGIFLDSYSGLVTAVATAFIAWFTLSLRQSTDRLWDAGDKQLGLLKRSADISERALTELEAPFTAIKIIDTGLTKKTTEIGHDFGMLKFSVTNDGRTPARLVELVDTTRLIPEESGNPPPINLDFRSRDTMPYGVISPPNSESQPFTRNLLLYHMNELAADAIPLRRNVIFFYGFVRYETIFKQSYRMGFCYMFDKFSERWLLSGDEKYNYLEKEG